MTVDVARRRTRKTTKVVSTPDQAPMRASESFAIGEIGQTVFSCPNCQRPLAIGAKHCPGCKTHLVGGVKLSKAFGFAAFGLIVGLAVGGGAGGAALLSSSMSRDAEIASRVAAAVAAAEAARPAPVETTSPLATAQPVVTPAPVNPDAVPPLARSAMIQAANVNAGLAAAVPVLQGALAAKTFDTYTVFQVLRSVSADAVTGRPLATPIAAWSGGKELAEGMNAYYSQVQDVAAESLSASIRNTAAYKAAAKAMITVLGGLPALDAQLHEVATDAGVSFPAAETP